MINGHVILPVRISISFTNHWATLIMAKQDLGKAFDPPKPGRKEEQTLGSVYDHREAEFAKARKEITQLELGEGVRKARIEQLEANADRTGEEQQELEALQTDQKRLDDSRPPLK